jgi:hypothetical protein
MAGLKIKTATKRRENKMKTKELDVTHIDRDKTNNHINNLKLEGGAKPDILDEHANEIAFSV